MGVFSTNDLEDLEKEVLRLARKYPKEAKKFLQKQGNKLKAKAKKKGTRFVTTVRFKSNINCSLNSGDIVISPSSV